MGVGGREYRAHNFQRTEQASRPDASATDPIKIGARRVRGGRRVRTGGSDASGVRYRRPGDAQRDLRHDPPNDPGLRAAVAGGGLVRPNLLRVYDDWANLSSVDNPTVPAPTPGRPTVVARRILVKLLALTRRGQRRPTAAPSADAGRGGKETRR